MDPTQPLLAELRAVVEALDAAGFPVMVVGGLATFAWGEPRTTRELDVAVHVGDKGPEAVAQALGGLDVEVQGRFSTMFGPRFILPFDTGLPVDLFLSQDRTPFDRRRTVSLDGEDLPVQSPEDLVLGKLAAAQELPDERGRDLDDALGVVYKQWDRFDWTYADQRCETYGVCEALETLRDEVRQKRQG